MPECPPERTRLFVCEHMRSERTQGLQAPIQLTLAMGPDQSLPNDAGGPLTEYSGRFGVDAIAHRHDGIEGVIANVTVDCAAPFLANYSEIPNSCRAFQLALLVDFIRCSLMVGT
jgi:hypothetical protein